MKRDIYDSIYTILIVEVECGCSEDKVVFLERIISLLRAEHIEKGIEKKIEKLFLKFMKKVDPDIKKFNYKLDEIVSEIIVV